MAETKPDLMDALRYPDDTVFPAVFIDNMILVDRVSPRYIRILIKDYMDVLRGKFSLQDFVEEHI